MLGFPPDLITTYRDLLVALPTTYSDQPLLTIIKGAKQVMVTTDLLAKGLTVMLDSLQLA